MHNRYIFNDSAILSSFNSTDRKNNINKNSGPSLLAINRMIDRTRRGIRVLAIVPRAWTSIHFFSNFRGYRTRGSFSPGLGISASKSISHLPYDTPTVKFSLYECAYSQQNWRLVSADRDCGMRVGKSCKTNIHIYICICALYLCICLFIIYK